MYLIFGEVARLNQVATGCSFNVYIRLELFFSSLFLYAAAEEARMEALRSKLMHLEVAKDQVVKLNVVGPMYNCKPSAIDPLIA